MRRDLIRKYLPWLALAVVVVISLAILVARSEPSDSTEARARRLERELACPVCTGESVADSNSPAARAIKVDIRDRIEAGQSDAEIKQAYVDVYRERVLLRPGDDGIALIAWGVPVVVLVVGAGGIALALRTWSRQPRLAATAEDEVVVERARHTERDP
jgi:cytochrome c-type biogenesis protein CcmH